MEVAAKKEKSLCQGEKATAEMFTRLPREDAQKITMETLQFQLTIQTRLLIILGDILASRAYFPHQYSVPIALDLQVTLVYHHFDSVSPTR